MQARVVIITLLSTLILMLQGCGGSGGSGDTASSTSQYTVGGTVSGMNSTGLVLQNNGGDDLPVAGVDFEFATALDNGSSYDVTILNQPTDQICTIDNAHNTIDGANITDVSVTCRNWQPAVALDDGSATFTMFPDIGFDADGNALAVWVQDHTLYANRYTAGSGWGTAEQVASSVAGNAEPRLVVDSSGTALVVWMVPRVDAGLYYYDLWANRYTPTGGWETAERIARDSYWDYPPMPAIDMDPDGNAFVVWTQSLSDSAEHIWSNRYTAGQGWRDAEPVDRIIPCEYPCSYYVSDPEIALDDNGNALVIFAKGDGIYVNRYGIRSGWSTEPVLLDSDATARHADIAMHADGDAIAVWSQSDGTRDSIWASRYTAEGGWAAAELIENDDTGDAIKPRVAIDESGNAIVVWEQLNSIYANYYSADTNTWGAAGVIEDDDLGNASNVEVAFDADGNAIATWQNFVGSNYYGWANTYSVSNGWGVAGPLDADESKVGGAPRLAIDPDGNAIVVWGQTNIWASHYE